jgi:riboflavin synthase
MTPRRSRALLEQTRRNRACVHAAVSPYPKPRPFGRVGAGDGYPPEVSSLRRVFTGIVRERGTVLSVEGGEEGVRLVIEAPATADSTGLGDSVSVDGVDLTAIDITDGQLSFTAVPETLARSTVGRLAPGSEVNLEPALRAGEPLGGHYVQGHVDGTCRVRSVERDGVGLRVFFEAPPALLRYVVEKGSVAIHGVALTVTTVDDESFGVALIPYTLSETTLGTIAVGDELNLEVDVLAKYVERLMAGGIPSSS